MVVIIIDHVQFFPSLYDFITGQALLWVSAAEGFFFISGLLIGMIRRREHEHHGLAVVTRKCYRRAATLYVTSIILTLGFTLLGWALTSHNLSGSKYGLIAPNTGLVSLLWQTLTMRYTYGWADFLNYYVIYLLIAPIAIWLMARRGDLLVLSVSLGLWLAHFWLGKPEFNDVLTWQIYFFTGMIVGTRWRGITHYFRALPARGRGLMRRAIVGAAVATILLSFIYTFGAAWIQPHGQFASGISYWLRQQTSSNLYVFLFTDDRHGLLRYPLALLWMAGFYLVVRRYEALIIRYLGWLLLPIGINTLYVYILQSLLAYLVHLVKWPVNVWLGTLLATAAILILWYPTRQRWLFGIIPR